MGSITNGNGHATGDDEGHVASFWTRYDQLKHSGVMKDVLIEEVITRYENLVIKHSDYVHAHETEREQAQHVLQREQRALTNVVHLQAILNRDPFILVLVDGDGMIFNSEFVRQGDAGGKQAATVLHNAVQEWSLVNVGDCPKDVQVIVRVYANLKGLSDVCVKTGVSCPGQVEEFARGFTRGKTLFDFVDVGFGKDRADGKVAETFKLFLYDYHCRQILFGCSHDNGYARILEQYAESGEALQRVTLLEGVPFEKELAVLPFRTKKFAGIFRDTKIVSTPPDLLTGQSNYRQRVDSRGLSATSEVFTPRSNTPYSPTYTPSALSQTDSRLPSRPVAPPQHMRTTSFASSAGSAESGAQSSWAFVAKTSASRPLTNLPRTASGNASALMPVKEKEIRRNKAGHRIDEALEYDRDEVQRLKKIKMCNQHYIGSGCCHYNAGKPDKCPHRHDLKLSANERYYLLVVARETPCKKGLYCDDTKCIYGHRCPFPVATEGSLRGSGMCLNGDHCRFGLDMHGVDVKVVKTLRVTGAF